MDSERIEKMIQLLEKKDIRTLSKAITIVDNDEPEKEALMNYAYKNMKDTSLIVGITGPGGAGKSTLIDKIISVYRKENKTVGLIAVDPSSPYSGGAFLGDRVRMGAHNVDDGVYIRSLGSRGTLGGISRTAKCILYLYKTFGFDVIIVESLGVGQDETEISNFVDVTVVTLVPGYGDAIQMAKAGVQEIADIFIINKSDKPDAEALKQTLLNSFFSIPKEKRPFVLNTIATDNIGIEDVVNAINQAGQRQLENREAKCLHRLKAEIKSETMRYFENSIDNIAETMAKEVLNKKQTPFEVASEIINKININL